MPRFDRRTIVADRFPAAGPGELRRSISPLGKSIVRRSCGWFPVGASNERFRSSHDLRSGRTLASATPWSIVIAMPIPPPIIATGFVASNHPAGPVLTILHGNEIVANVCVRGDGQAVWRLISDLRELAVLQARWREMTTGGGGPKT